RSTNGVADGRTSSFNHGSRGSRVVHGELVVNFNLGQRSGLVGCLLRRSSLFQISTLLGQGGNLVHIGVGRRQRVLRQSGVVRRAGLGCSDGLGLRRGRQQLIVSVVDAQALGGSGVQTRTQQNGHIRRI